MKRKQKRITRLCSMLLIVCMMISLLPMSVITFAEGTEPVSVTWMPERQTNSGKRQVTLTAGLTQSEGSPAAALIDVYLDEGEAEALQWNEESVDESELTPWNRK